MKVSSSIIAVFLASLSSMTTGFNMPSRISCSTAKSNEPKIKSTSAALFPQPRSRYQGLTSIGATAISPSEEPRSYEKGILAFKTKYGYLNPFAIYYGVTAILLGLPWFVALTACQIMYMLFKGFDKKRALPMFFSHIWGTLLLLFTRSKPEVIGADILKKFNKEGRAGMFVANHNSWMDIPFVGTTMGLRNYKLISKIELGKVPILGKAIKVGGHVMVDRSSRKSQIKTLKSGMQCLKDGMHLCAFPEGTRSKTGRMLPFKNGAFKMAYKVGAPVVPMSIVASGKAHPANWMFPCRSSHGICKIIIHEPIESTGKTETELAALVREKIIEGLPEDQHPLD